MTKTYETATTPEEVVRIFTEFFNAGDVDGLMSMYDEDATFSPEFGVLATGTTEIRGIIAAMTDPAPKVASNVKWVQQVGDYALVLNEYTIHAVGPDGAAVEVDGRTADVVHRAQDGTWRYFIDCLWAGAR